MNHMKHKRMERTKKMFDEEGVKEEEAKKQKWLAQSARQTMLMSRSWQEVQYEEDQRRKDRIEGRKNELAQSSYPTQRLQESVEKWKQRKQSPPPLEPPPFVAQDPEEVSWE